MEPRSTSPSAPTLEEVGAAVTLFGTAGWSYPDWEGRVYPQKKTKGFQPLRFLSRFVDTVEVNSTFYRPPASSMCEKWVRMVEEQETFLFTLKLWQGFTHERTRIRSEDVRAFRDGIGPIVTSGRLGAVLVQFPWSFRACEESQRWLAGLVDAFGDLPLVVEVRHASWNEAGFYLFLAERHVGIANIDQPVFPRSIGPSARVTSAVGYVRLHGRNYENWFREDAGRDDRYDYLYSREELDGWLKRIRRVGQSSQKTFVIANNHFGGQALANALELKHMAMGKRVRVPDGLVQAFPRLAEIASGTDSEKGPESTRGAGQGQLPF
jgi:uncharacterized protein YecE (DUF72 family)